jgi:DNA polymerase-3 subunit epsilon
VRELLFDTETTGLSPEKGHRLVSLAAIELIDHQPTGRFVHYLLNPERESDPQALAIHGLTTELLSTQPKFSAIVPAFLEFWGLSPLVIHNAPFDLSFLRAELVRAGCGLPVIAHSCTLSRARGVFGSGSNKLDSLVARFGVRNLRAATGKHGALIDCLLLLPVYQHLRGVVATELTDEFLQLYGVLDGASNQDTGSPSAVGQEQSAAVCPALSSGVQGTGAVATGDTAVLDPATDGVADAGIPAAGDAAGDSGSAGVTRGT